MNLLHPKGPLFEIMIQQAQGLTYVGEDIIFSFPITKLPVK
jgi:hypothetical protein